MACLLRPGLSYCELHHATRKSTEAKFCNDDGYALYHHLLAQAAGAFRCDNGHRTGSVEARLFAAASSMTKPVFIGGSRTLVIGGERRSRRSVLGR